MAPDSSHFSLATESQNDSAKPNSYPSECQPPLAVHRWFPWHQVPRGLLWTWLPYPIQCLLAPTAQGDFMVTDSRGLLSTPWRLTDSRLTPALASTCIPGWLLWPQAPQNAHESRIQGGIRVSARQTTALPGFQPTPTPVYSRTPAASLSVDTTKNMTPSETNKILMTDPKEIDIYDLSGKEIRIILLMKFC